MAGLALGWKKSLILPIVLFAALSGCAKAHPWPWVVEVGGAPLKVDVAATHAQRQRGLMYRDSLDDGWGMIFVFAAEEPLTFWMENTTVPLSIAFVGSDLVVRDIQDMEPMSRALHPSKAPAKYAIEVNKGWFASRGIAPGARVQFSPGLEEYLRAHPAE